MIVAFRFQNLVQISKYRHRTFFASAAVNMVDLEKSLIDATKSPVLIQVSAILIVTFSAEFVKNFISQNRDSFTSRFVLGLFVLSVIILPNSRGYFLTLVCHNKWSGLRDSNSLVLLGRQMPSPSAKPA